MLVILGVAVGLTSYLVDAQVAARVTVEWAQTTIHSKFVFLLALNGLLLLVGRADGHLLGDLSWWCR